MLKCKASGSKFIFAQNSLRISRNKKYGGRACEKLAQKYPRHIEAREGCKDVSKRTVRGLALTQGGPERVSRETRSAEGTVKNVAGAEYGTDTCATERRGDAGMRGSGE